MLSSHGRPYFYFKVIVNSEEKINQSLNKEKIEFLGIFLVCSLKNCVLLKFGYKRQKFANLYDMTTKLDSSPISNGYEW